ncbi:MAG: type II toxin-antitoxin system VapC family toxin [Cytophagales bacterium]|nr:type II toxin-antitoxin system VapC family toxin [Cytophagales bacterium]
MGKRYLIDSNSIIDYLNGILPEEGADLLRDVVNEVPVISFISKIEVLSFKSDEATELLLREFINSSSVIEITNDIIDATISIRKERKIKVPDAIIGATALTLDLTLITRNTKDFNGIRDLRIINPWERSPQS